MENINTQKDSNIIFWIAKWFGVCFILVICIFGIYNLFINGSLSTCEYKEEILNIPDYLNNTPLKLEKDISVIKGVNPEHCSKSFRRIKNELLDNNSVNDPSFGGMRYYTNQGRGVEEIKSGTIFYIVSYLSQTKHGFKAIDSGSHPISFLILKDEQGNLYETATWYINKDAVPLSYSKNGQIQILNLGR